jgi:hypothetical protein
MEEHTVRLACRLGSARKTLNTVSMPGHQGCCALCRGVGDESNSREKRLVLDIFS